jgi:hypothetical protein
MSPNRAMSNGHRHNSWYWCHKASLLNLSIKLWFERDRRSTWMSEWPSFSCLPTMLLLLSHFSSSHYPVVIEHLDLSVDGTALYCLSGQPILTSLPPYLLTWSFYLRWDSHKFHIIIELLKVLVDLFALISPRISFPCNYDDRNVSVSH